MVHQPEYIFNNDNTSEDEFTFTTLGTDIDDAFIENDDDVDEVIEDDYSEEEY